MPNVTLRNATDTWADSTRASKNFNGQKFLHVRSGDRNGYLFFNRAAPLGATITSAILTLYPADSAGSSKTWTVQRLAAAWKVSRLTWNNKPGVIGSAISATDPGGAANRPITLNLTSLFQAVSDGGAWFGLRLTTNDASDRRVNAAEGLSAYRPTLAVAWTEAPEAPTTLSPSGNRAVSINKPVVRFDFTDSLGDTSLAAVQVQVDPAQSWTTPAFDSGSVAASDPELDLSATAYAGLADGASTWWRVRVQDGSGLWSAWSDGAQFKRDDLGTVTILNPSGATLSDPTPPFIWSLTGETQKAWQVQLWDPADPATILGDSGKQTGTDTSWTPPSGVLTGPGPYVVRVRLWDTKDREAVPNGASTATATRQFTITDDPAVAPVVGLDANQPNNVLPRVLLTWTRSTAPDRFVIYRDGQVIEDDLDPADAITGATSYEYEDDESKVWKAHTWKVKCIVNGAGSPSDAVTATTAQRGIWLLDKGRGLSCWIAGQSGGTWAIGEEATVFTPVGGKNVVRRVQARRGYEGNLDGTLIDAWGRTADDYENDLLAMRDQPNRPVVLALADMAIRVILGNVTTYPTPGNVPPVRVASFDFWQVLS